jgi:NADH dehydrogenase
VLPQLQPRIATLVSYATAQLERYGVDLRLGARLAQVTPAGALLSDGIFIPSATVISTVGQRVVTIPGLESLPRVESGRLVADPYLRVTGQDNIWVGGDVAQAMRPTAGAPCPSDALWAIKHGECIGQNVGLMIRDKPLRPFTYRGLGQAASLGVGKGAAELYGVCFTGWVAWLLRLVFFLRFVPSRTQRMRVLLDVLTLPVLGRHVTPLGYAAAVLRQEARQPGDAGGLAGAVNADGLDHARLRRHHDQRHVLRAAEHGDQLVAQG